MHALTVELAVHVAFDEEAGVWYVAHSDVPGLNLENERVSDLLRRIEDTVPDLVELNCQEIVAAHLAANPPQAEPSQRPRFVTRPIFDSPLRNDLACA